MRPLSVLFYVEPVCYRSDPLFHIGWVDWIARIMQSQPPGAGLLFGFASSPYLSRAHKQRLGKVPCWQYDVNPRDVLAPFAFDRHAYGRDLYGAADDEEINGPLADFLRKVGESFAPDVVISFTQNRYIEKIFAKQRTLFWEVGPLPRHEGKLSFFMDPCGHQQRNLLNGAADRILHLPLDPAYFDAARQCWEQFVLSPLKANSPHGDISSWLDGVRQGHPIALFAMQPPDGLTIEAAYEVLTPEALIMRWMQHLPPSWTAFATYHTGHKLPLAVESMLAEEFPAFRMLPESMAALGSEAMLPYIDAVATISSSVGMTALLHGKAVVSYGRSWLNALTGKSLSEITRAPHLTEQERMSLFLFLTNYYCHPLEDCLATPGYVAGVIRRLVEASNPVELYFDFDAWSPERVRRLLIPAAAHA